MRSKMVLVMSLIGMLSYDATPAIGQRLGDSYFRIPSDSFVGPEAFPNEAPVRRIQFRPSNDLWNKPDSITYKYQDGVELSQRDIAPENAGFFENSANMARQFGSNVAGDYQSFYSGPKLKFLGVMFLIGGGIANTSLDQSLRDIFVESNLTIPTKELPEFLHLNKSWGDGIILLPAYATISITGKYLLDDPTADMVGDWSERTIRGILVGTPPLLIAQKFTGGSRPNETNHGSDWQPFADDNGVSGHAFMGAIPFLTAAKMSKNRLWKGTFIAASTLPGISRITDDAHYPSQVVLGWTLAWVATSAVNDTQMANRNISIEPMIIDGSTGIGLSIRH